MDCYSVESEFIESLDFLSPPVKRIHNSRDAFGSAYNNEANDVHLLRGLRHKFTRRAPSSTRNSRLAKANAESSTSLILKRTSERKILEHYSIVSYTSLQHPEDDIVPQRKLDRINAEKPLIKVTVIPKTDQVQTAKILRKRRYIPRKIESTTSNHENSIQTKNVYLIVAGRRKEKIYEIKTTGSATLSTDRDSCAKDEDIPIKQICNFKHLVKSFNMDKKKKKEVTAQMAETTTPQQSFYPGGYQKCQECKCNHSRENLNKKSRVRIFGQFGISEDDKYVLRYGATVNNKEVLSDVAKLTRDFTPVMMPMSSFTTQDENAELQRDSCIQADYDNEFEMEQLPVKDEIPSNESQGTQVNFNVQIATKLPVGGKLSDKNVQCSCCNMEHIKSDYNKGLKDCQSPLVIISVYPKQSPEDITKSIQSAAKEILRTPSPPSMHTYNANNPILKIDKNTRNSDETRRRNKSPPIGRSHSPVRKVSRSTLQEDKVTKLHVVEKKSPEPQLALKAIKQKIKDKDTRQDAMSKRTSRFTSNSSQMTKNLHNISASNATQVSKNKEFSSSSATQGARYHPTFTASSANQYGTSPQSLTINDAMQCVDSPNNIAQIKHSKNIETFSQTPAPFQHKNKSVHVTDATQMPKTHVFMSNATQVSKNDRATASNATQVSKNQQNFIASRVFKHQQTLTTPLSSKSINNETSIKSRPLLKLIVERGTNTDHARAKQALIQSYTQKLTEKINQMDYVPDKYEDSKVTININSNDYYDMMYNQDKAQTNVNFRKTIQEIGSQKRDKDESSVESQKNTLSVAVCKTQSEDDTSTPLDKHVSRITIRDSIEISHKREDKGNTNYNNHNIKNTQTCFTAQFKESSPDETEFSAPIKHYAGDDCCLSNPIERDKQIRELLGVEKNKSFVKKAYHTENDDRFPYQCFYSKKSQVTEINFQFQNVGPYYKPIHFGNQKSVQSTSVQCRYSNHTNSDASHIIHANDMKKGIYGNTVYAIYNKKRNENITGDTIRKGKSDIHQQAVLNKHMHVFLQVEHISKQKPIILSRKQYKKVKKTIQKTICRKRSSDDKRKKAVSNKSERSVVSVGEVRLKKLNEIKLYNEREAQTNPDPCGKESWVSEKHTNIWNGKTRNVKSGPKQGYSDQSCDQSRGDQVVEQSQKTSRNTDISVERHRPRKHRSHSRKKRRSSEQRERKSTRCTKVYTIDQPCANVSVCTSLKAFKGERDEETKAVRLLESPIQRNIQTHAELSDENHGDFSSEQLSDKKERHISDRHSGQKESYPDHEKNYSDQKKSYTDQKKNYSDSKKSCSDRKESSSVERYKEHNSPERYSERKENRKKNARDFETGINEYEDSIEYNAEEHKCKEVKTLVLFNADNIKDKPQDTKEIENDVHTRKTLSSMEIHYAGVAYMKHIGYSSTDVGAVSDSSLAHVNSFRTIFRGHRKSPTPNLGTSAYSLYSEDVLNSDTKCAKFIMEPRDSKPKKPFLRRLMSCLVMRSTRDSELKLPACPAPDIPSANSSVDSYHISTSLGAVEVSSSIYDTSASFYSNHTILPVNSKIKRGFFSSVRGFLTNRKS